MKTNHRYLTLFAIVILLTIYPLSFATAEDPPNILPKVRDDAAVAKSDEPGRYIIKFEDPPLALYSGGIKGLLATRPSAIGRTKLDPAGPASTAYRNHLAQRKKDIQTKMGQAIGRSLAFSNSYSVVLNGAVVTLRSDEVAAVKKIPGVVGVQRDTLRFVHTDAGPDWIDAPDLWTGASSTYGEGIVIGIVDSGINPENPSFADIGGDGYNHSNPRGRFYGVCNPDHDDYDEDFPCNDKLIGAYDFTSLVPETENTETPLDVSGHGSHTASTAAGNVVSATATAPTTTLSRDISGVAPHANIISYRTIRSIGTAYISVLVAAIEQAVIDGVDVINYSIGGSANTPWNDMDSEAFLAARQAGVFVATSAGNSGPTPGSIGSPGNSPWLLTVGASTHDRRLNSTLSGLTRDDGGSLESIVGKSLSSDYGPASIVYAGDHPNPNDDEGDDPALCLNPYPAGTFNGEIVVCDRGENGRVAKGENVLAGGASGYVLANDAANDRSLSADAHVLPAVHITYTDGIDLKNWLDVGSNHEATISGTTVDIADQNGDIMAGFSSRGENTPVPSIIKPDVTAPGVDILAAGGTDGAVKWEVMSGTSMSSPHAAGAAALIMARHPLWTLAEIQSALMSSATAVDVFKEDEVIPADAFDMGTGRLDLLAADRAGVVLDESYENFVAADPAVGGDPSTLNLASLGQDVFVYSTTWTRVLRSVAAQNVQWTAFVVNPPNVALTVEPASFTLSPDATQAVSIRADASQAPLDKWFFGRVMLEPDVEAVAAAHFPVAVKAAVSNLPDMVVVNDAASEGIETVTSMKAALAITDLTSTRFGLAAAEVTEGAEGTLYQDPTPSTVTSPTGDYPPENGVFRDIRVISSGLRRLVYEIKNTTSPDLNMFVTHWDGTAWHTLFYNTIIGSKDLYFNIDNPAAGQYNLYIQNYAASDPSGGVPDEFTLAIAEVPNTDSGNMSVALGGGGSSVPTGQAFDLDIQWSLAWTSPYWYGAFELGTDSGSPGNLGSVYVNIAADRCEGDDEGDNDTDGSDLAVFADYYGDSGCPGGCPGDFDHSGTVDELDLAVLAADYGRLGCP